MRTLLCCAVLLALPAIAAADDTPAAAKMRKLLKTKITVEFKDTSFRDVIAEIKDDDKLKNNLKVIIDTKSGVSGNRKITYKAADKSVEDILADLCKEVGGIGYYVVSKKGDAYDGSVKIRVGEERGAEKGK